MGSTPIRASLFLWRKTVDRVFKTATMWLMRRQSSLLRLALFFSTSLLFSACTLFQSPKGMLRVISSVGADVYLDGKNVGTTPFSKNSLEVKKYQVKVVPQDPALASEEAQIKLFPGVEATLDWQFGRNREESSGFILEIENAHKRNASELEIITSPDNVPVTINNENKGFSPLVIDSLSPGGYQLGLQAPGYSDIARMVTLIKGKRMIVTVKLARKPVEIASPSAQLAPLPTPDLATPKPKVTPKPSPKLAVQNSSSSGILGTKTAQKPYIEVLETPTGFLRVRSQPSASGTILGQLNVGDTAPYGGQTTDNWFKIVFGATSSAWVSGQYSRLVQ